MNPEELLLIARVINLKIQKYHHFKPAYGTVYDFTKSLLFDFPTIYVGTYVMLNRHIKLHPLQDTIILQD